MLGGARAYGKAEHKLVVTQGCHPYNAVLLEAPKQVDEPLAPQPAQHKAQRESADGPKKDLSEAEAWARHLPSAGEANMSLHVYAFRMLATQQVQEHRRVTLCFLKLQEPSLGATRFHAVPNRAGACNRGYYTLIVCTCEALLPGAPTHRLATVARPQRNSFHRRGALLHPRLLHCAHLTKLALLRVHKARRQRAKRTLRAV